MRILNRTAPIFGVLVLVSVVVGVATPAFAHSQLISTNPVAQATVTQPTSEISLTFNEPVQGRFSTIVVNGPGGVSYSNGDVRVVDSTAHEPVLPLRSGSYTVAWRIVSADGHPITGEFGFTVNLPPELEPTDGPPTGGPLAAGDVPASGGPSPWWAWLAVVAALVLSAIAVKMLLRSRGKGRRP